jgi:hypothetical protein
MILYQRYSASSIHWNGAIFAKVMFLTHENMER